MQRNLQQALSLIVHIVGEDNMLDLMSGIKEKDEKGDKKLVQVSMRPRVTMFRPVRPCTRTHGHAQLHKHTHHDRLLPETQEAWEGWKLREDTRRSAERGKELRDDVREITDPSVTSWLFGSLRCRPSRRGRNCYTHPETTRPRRLRGMVSGSLCIINTAAPCRQVLFLFDWPE